MKPNAIEISNLNHGEIYACAFNGNPKGAWKLVWQAFRSNRSGPADAYHATAEYEEVFDDRKRCVLCGSPIAGYGNNPDPLAQAGRCCDDCNTTKVIPARIAALRGQG